MQKRSFFWAMLVFWTACQAPSAPKAADQRAQLAADSTAIAQTIHDFFNWYEGFQMDTANDIDFTNAAGKHLKLDVPKLEKRLAAVRSSSLVSDAFLDGERAFYRKCETLWADESIDDVPSGMDADKYFCAQDWELDFWTKSPVRVVKTGENMARATLYDKKSDASEERSFKLSKQNGKWLLDEIECDMFGEAPN